MSCIFYPSTLGETSTRYIYTTITKAESVISPKSHPAAAGED